MCKGLQEWAELFVTYRVVIIDNRHGSHTHGATWDRLRAQRGSVRETPVRTQVTFVHMRQLRQRELMALPPLDLLWTG